MIQAMFISTINNNHNFCLSVCDPCVQGGKNNYAELLFPRKKDVNTGQVEWINSSPQAHMPRSDILEHNTTSPLQNESPAQPTSPSARLYPSLETELTTLNLQSMVIRHQQTVKMIMSLKLK